ncbi:MAG: hypothetical protein ACR2OC_02415, partial [Solirubrobacterales bacterium]
ACDIQIGFGGVSGADTYTADITRSDGSVQDLGVVGGGEGGGSATALVPYVGSGTYTVTVSAWGEPDEENDGERGLLERDRDGAGERHSGRAEAKSTAEAEAEAIPAAEADPAPAGEGDVEAPPVAEPPDPAPVAEPAPAEPAPPAPELPPAPDCAAAEPPVDACSDH